MPATRRSRRRNQRPWFAPGGPGGTDAPGFLLRDMFLVDAAAGALANRNCEPGPGQIIGVTDTDTAIAVASGVLSFSGAGPSNYANSRVTLTGQTRTAGRVLLIETTPAGTAGFATAGWNPSNPAAASTMAGPLCSSGGAVHDFTLNAASFQLGTYTAAALQKFAVVLRATGHVLLQLVSGRWKVLYVHNLSTTTPMYPAIMRHSNARTYDNLRVLSNLWQTPIYASDSFNRANGALGSTDGAGVEEPGGSGLAWSVLQGTCAVASNVAAFSARDGTSGIGMAVVETGSGDGFYEVTQTTGAAAGGRPGIAFRVTDATNYWVAYIDNSANLLRIDEVVAGSVTNRASVAATVADSTAYRLFVIADGASVVAGHNNVTRAAYASAATGLTAGKVGLYVDTAVDVTFENFAARPRYVDSFAPLAA